MNSTSIPIVFIHIGGAPPEYAREAVWQARRWNPSADIIFLSSVIPGDGCGVGEKWLTLDRIPKSAEHLHFEKVTKLDPAWRNGFWKATTERLFILEEWMRLMGIEECLHMEYDNMLYADISELVPVLRSTSMGLSAPFQGQGKKKDQLLLCFSVLYCKSVDALTNFLVFLGYNQYNKSEMQRGGEYWKQMEEECSVLPSAPKGVKIVSEEYRDWFENPRFPCIFDAAAHGQFLGGGDPRNHFYQGPGYMNDDGDFRADQFLYGWKADAEGRRYPVVTGRDGKEWKLANLHVHCKRLHDFI